MIHQDGHFSSHDGTKLYHQSWQPSQAEGCKAILVLVHGSGEHSGRYDNVVNYFEDRFYALYGFDFRGHGKSEGKVSHVMNWQEYREDLDSFLRFVQDKNPDKTLFLYGHSMGAQISLDYLTFDKHVPLAGMISSAAAIAPPKASASLILIGKFLSKVWPTFTLGNGLDVKDISRDPEVVKAYIDDPLVSSKISARFAAEFLACISRVQSNAAKIDVPLFMFHGETDKIIPAAGSKQYFEKVSLADKKLKIYKDGFHEPHNDLQKQEVFQDVEQWLEKRS